MGPVPVLICVFCSGRHICGIMSVNVPFLGSATCDARSDTSVAIYQSSPIQQSSEKFLFGIDNMLLGLPQVQLLCPNWGHILLEID